MDSKQRSKIAKLIGNAPPLRKKWAGTVAPKYLTIVPSNWTKSSKGTPATFKKFYPPLDVIVGQMVPSEARGRVDRAIEMLRRIDHESRTVVARKRGYALPIEDHTFAKWVQVAAPKDAKIAEFSPLIVEKAAGTSHGIVNFIEVKSYAQKARISDIRKRMKAKAQGIVISADSGDICTCTLSLGSISRSYPSTREACVTAASEFGLQHKWTCP